MRPLQHVPLFGNDDVLRSIVEAEQALLNLGSETISIGDDEIELTFNRAEAQRNLLDGFDWWKVTL